MKKEIRDFNLRYPFVNPLDGNESDDQRDSSDEYDSDDSLEEPAPLRPRPAFGRFF